MAARPSRGWQSRRGSVLTASLESRRPAEPVVVLQLWKLFWCQRQLNSERFRQSEIDLITVGCCAKLELTHLLVLAQRQCQ